MGSRYAFGIPGPNGETKEMSVAVLKTQSPRFAINLQRNLPANDNKATAIHGCCKPFGPLGFLGWASRRANRIRRRLNATARHLKATDYVGQASRRYRRQQISMIIVPASADPARTRTKTNSAMSMFRPAGRIYGKGTMPVARWVFVRERGRIRLRR